MRAFVGVTDNDWYRFLRSRPELDEVNFWQPSGRRQFRSLQPGEPFLFKLHHPENFIVGLGFFAHSTILPSTLVWDAFGEKNGAASYAEMRRRIAKYRRAEEDPREDYRVGCILLQQPVFFDRSDWIAIPADFSRNIVQGKSYDLTKAPGRELWQEIEGRLRTLRLPRYGETGPMYGDPVVVRQRLGQGTFRVLVTDVYQRRCAVTGEKVLPVLQAAHIQPVSEGGTHRVDNGLLLRSDLHTLFDRGYVTVSPRYRLRVSQRLKRDFDNGEQYYRLKDSPLWVPKTLWDRPNRQFLEWHADTVFRG
ncbi:MAG: HNH endonuclease [Acidobacteriota bacterium]